MADTVNGHMKPVRITRTAYQQMLSICANSYPNEACGLLIAHDASEGTIDEAVSIRNASSMPERAFAFDPEEWIRTLYRTQKNRQAIVGLFHSHPSMPPNPSEADLDGIALFAKDGMPLSYWILSLTDNRLPQCRAYLRQEQAAGLSVLTQVSIQIA